MLAGFEHTDAAGAAVSGTIAAGILPAAIEMMDAITIEAAEAAVNANYPPGCGAVLIVELDGPTAQVEEDLARDRGAVRRERRREIRIASDAGRPRRASGAGARPRSRRWAASAPTTTCRTASCRARSCPRCCAGSTSSRASTACASATSSTRATATCIRSCSTTAASTARPSARSCSRGQILEACIDAGGSITGEHGVGSDKACAMPLMFGEDDLAAMQRVRARVRPARARESREGLPDAAALRRGAGPVPRASAREGRACRALLSRGSSSTSRAT